MKATNIFTLSSNPAAKEWEKIPLIKHDKPHPFAGENSLQRFDGTNMCYWYLNSGDALWKPVSDMFS